jgi:hypothetical protein
MQVLLHGLLPVCPFQQAAPGLRPREERCQSRRQHVRVVRYYHRRRTHGQRRQRPANQEAVRLRRQLLGVQDLAVARQPVAAPRRPLRRRQPAVGDDKARMGVTSITVSHTTDTYIHTHVCLLDPLGLAASK